MKKIIACASLLILIVAVYQPGQAQVAQQAVDTLTPLVELQLSSFPEGLQSGDLAGVTPAQNIAVEATTPLTDSAAIPPVFDPALLDASLVQPVQAEETSFEPMAGSCQQAITNGGFENNTAWLAAPEGDVAYSTVYAHQGTRSIFSRTYNSNQQTFANASFWQKVSIPIEATDIVIEFYSKVIRADKGETVYLSIYDESFSNLLTYYTLTYPAGNNWVKFNTVTFNPPLDPAILRGKTVNVAFQLAKDSDSAYSEVNFDDVSLTICSPTPTPTFTPLPTATPTPTFTSTPTPTPTPTTGQPPMVPLQDFAKTVALGDWDNDGDLDRAFAYSFNTSNGQLLKQFPVDVLVNATNNSGRAHWQSPVVHNARAVAWADWDKDGDLDLTVGNDRQPTLIYENDGTTLQFDPAQGLGWQTDVSEPTWSIAWGDYDRDGDLDLAVGNYLAANRVYRNDGGVLVASWQAPQAYATTSVAWADWDNDGDLDLAMGNYGQPTLVYENSGGAWVLNPAQALGWIAPLSTNTTSLAWGDWNNDGRFDLAVGNDGQLNQIYENDGVGLVLDPTKGRGWQADKLGRTYSIAWGEWNDDGVPDLVAGNYEQANDLYISKGNRSFQTVQLSGAYSTWSVAWGDMDNDSDQDIVVANWYDDRIELNLGGANLKGPLLFNDPAGQAPLISDPTRGLGWRAPEMPQTVSVAWGDWDNDNDLDLAVGNTGAPNQVYENSDGSLALDPAKGLGWRAPQTLSTGSVAWGDWDGDNDLDLAVGNFKEPNQVYVNNGGQLTLAWQATSASNTNSVAWGDWDNDDDLDLAVGNSWVPSQVYENTGGTLQFDPANGLGWQAPAPYNTWRVAWGDWDSDGDLDLALGNYEWYSQVYENTGGTLQLDPARQVGWQAPITRLTTSLAWSDWNGDGESDLVLGNWVQVNDVYLYNYQTGTLIYHTNPQSLVSDRTREVAWHDWDNDGDTDLIVSNLEFTSADDAYLAYENWGDNQSKLLWPPRSMAVGQTGNGRTTSLAWGDWDNDGDADLAAGNFGAPSAVYENALQPQRGQVNIPPSVVVDQPEAGVRANFFASSRVLRQATIPITYKLFDPEGDPVRLIRAVYSPNGGGRWFPATPAAGVITNNLETSPQGKAYTFVWNVAADLLKSDNVIFGIVAYPGFRGPGPYQTAFTFGKTMPLRVENTAPYAQVINSQLDAVANARIYSNGVPAGALTDRAGRVGLGALQPGQKLVALAPVTETHTIRKAHNGWAYRTYLTSLGWTATGEPQPLLVNGQNQSQKQLLTLGERPLILFNLVISIEWDATDAYLAEINRAVQSASDFLFDVTDGQMAFGEVQLYDNAQNWTEADVQISTHNAIRPHAYVGGIVDKERAKVMRLGRYWDGNSGNQGAWDQPNGYRTFVHEFGHYALHLYDEYFAYRFSSNGHLLGEADAYCPQPYELLPPDDTATASIMYYQYRSSELSAFNVPGMWSETCKQTVQWQRTLNPATGQGESAWQTLARFYSDPATPPRWQLATPLSRGSAVPGPQQLPDDILALPQVTISNTGASASLDYYLTVRGQGGVRVAGLMVSLEQKQGAGRRVIAQGFTDSKGRLNILGAHPNDTLRASAIDGTVYGELQVKDDPQLLMNVTPVQITAANQGSGFPYVQVVAQPDQDQHVRLRFTLCNFAQAQPPTLTVSRPGRAAAETLGLQYNATLGVFEGEIALATDERGAGQIGVMGTVGTDQIALHAPYYLQQLDNTADQNVFAIDGNVELFVSAGSLPGDSAALLVLQPGSLPGALPAGFALQSDVYAIGVSGDLPDFAKPVLLEVHASDPEVQASAEVGLYYWEKERQTWLLQPTGGLDRERLAISATIEKPGIYVLLAPVSVTLPTYPAIFLPVIQQ